MKWHVEYHNLDRRRATSVWADEMEDWDLTPTEWYAIRALAIHQTYEDSRGRVWTRV